jgi:hypothetical protein
MLSMWAGADISGGWYAALHCFVKEFATFEASSVIKKILVANRGEIAVRIVRAFLFIVM